MDVIELTQELVRVNSENPPGNEKEVAGFVKDWLEDKGFSPELINSGGNRYNVVASLGKGPDGLMLNGHLDTVPIGGNWTEEPLGGKVKDGKLYGRGSEDMKGGVAAILKAAEGLAKESLKKRLLLAFVADEEAGSRFGSEWLIKNRPEVFEGIKCGVIAEPTNMDIRLAQKGIFHFRARFFGKAAHGSVPHQGDNAILKASDFIQACRELAKGLGNVKDGLLGSGTINIGKIAGGVKVNVVPDKCEVDVDRRIVPPETFRTARKQFEDILERLGCRAEIEVLAERDPLKVSEDSRVVKGLLALWPQARLRGFPGYTEAELFSKDMGIECVAFGPGTGNTCHCADEYIETGQLEKCVGVFERLVRQWCV